MLQLKLIELLFAVHLDDKWHHQNKERCPRQPRRFSRAPQQLLRHVAGLLRHSLRGVAHSGESSNDAPAVVIGGGASMFALPQHRHVFFV